MHRGKYHSTPAVIQYATALIQHVGFEEKGCFIEQNKISRCAGLQILCSGPSELIKPPF